MTGWKHLVIVNLLFVTSTVYSKRHKYWDRDLTVLLAEGAEDCYFLPNIKATNEVDIEYQVSINRKKNQFIYWSIHDLVLIFIINLLYKS